MVRFTSLKRVAKKALERWTPVLRSPSSKAQVAVLFLHHSTGNKVWNGGVLHWLKDGNVRNGTAYDIVPQVFPKRSPYGWSNDPYDYWNIWVAHQSDKPYMQEPTLEMICARYDVVILKHCFPVSRVLEDTGLPDVASRERRNENYRAQYRVLKAKLRQFSDTRFIVWTGAALVRRATSEAEARRAMEFFEWVRNEWDEPGDNTFLWDFHALETEGQLYMKDEYAVGPTDSHPNPAFCRKVAPLLVQRLRDVIEGRGDSASLTGEP